MIRFTLFVVAFIFSLTCHAEQKKVTHVDTKIKGVSIIRLDAEVTALQQASVSAQMAGQLIWVASLGEEVAKGDIIAKKDSTNLKLGIARIKAVYQQTVNEIDFLQSDLSRLQALERKQLASEHLTDEARLNLQMKIDDLAILDAQLSIAENELVKMAILAPFDGIIAKRTHTEGEWVSQGEEVVRLFNPKSNQIRASVDITLLPRLDKSYKYMFDNGVQSDTAELLNIIPYVDPITQTVEVIFNPNFPEIWMTGQHVTVELPKAKLFSLSKSSVETVGTKHYITVKRESSIVRLQIEIVEEYQEKVVVSGAFKEGDKVMLASS